MKIGEVISIVLLMAVVVVYSNNSFEPFRNTIDNVCKSVRTLLPPIAMLMLIGAGVVYIGGQFTGAETRSRANVWATNLLIGALIGLIIAAVAPIAVDSLSQSAAGTSSQGTTASCSQPT
ncbi:MAG: hypothetical protein N3E37_03645 [Candidatus Micrarchaeota archaeon]|nr:hypothetical protein [Candidatus Micrarchaeota archaeon]